MPTKRNRRVGVQSRKVKKPKNVSRKLSVSGKAKKRRSSAHGSSTHGSGTRRRVQRGGDAALTGFGIALASVVGWLGLCAMIGGRSKLCLFKHTGSKDDSVGMNV